MHCEGENFELFCWSLSLEFTHLTWHKHSKTLDSKIVNSWRVTSIHWTYCRIQIVVKHFDQLIRIKQNPPYFDLGPSKRSRYIKIHRPHPSSLKATFEVPKSIESMADFLPPDFQVVVACHRMLDVVNLRVWFWGFGGEMRSCWLWTGQTWNNNGDQ